MDRQKVLKCLENGGTVLTASHAGLTEAQLREPGVMEARSVKDILAHVTIWKGEVPCSWLNGKVRNYLKMGKQTYEDSRS